MQGNEHNFHVIRLLCIRNLLCSLAHSIGLKIHSKQITSHELIRQLKGKGKAVPLQAWSGPEGSRKLRFPDYMTTAQDGGKVVSPTQRPPLPSGNAPGTHFCYRLSQPQGNSAIGRIMSMKNSNDTIFIRQLVELKVQFCLVFSVSSLNLAGVIGILH